MTSAEPVTDAVGYRTLEPGQIRIVLIERDNPDGPIDRYRLHTVGLLPLTYECGTIQESVQGTKRIMYSALSYTWGDPRTKVSLELTDGESEMTFNIDVTISTFRALEQLCSHSTESVLPIWIDQICINQISEAEKSVQVSMMNDIYGCSEKVFVWLGDPAEDSDLAFSAIEEWHALDSTRNIMSRSARSATASTMDQFGSSSTASRIIPSSDKDGLTATQIHFMRAYAAVENILAAGESSLRDLLDSVAALGEDSLEFVAQKGPRLWMATDALFDRPWFHRAWIRQEVTAVSPDAVLVYSGASVITWRTLLEYVLAVGAMHYRACTELSATDAARYDAAVSIMDFAQSRKVGATLLALLGEIRPADATDPRDKVYSVLGCASDISATEALLRADYSLIKEEVFIRFVIWYIEKYRNLDFLAYADPLMANKKYWLPQWDMRQVHLRPLQPSISTSSKYEVPLYNACGLWGNGLDVKGNIRFYPSFQPLLLGLRGVRVAKIGWISKAVKRASQGIVQEREWLHRLGTAVDPLRGTPMREVFARTIVADARPMRGVLDVIWSRNAAVDIETECNEPILSRIKYITEGRSVFTTEKSDQDDTCLVGIGPGFMQTGDEVFMFEGGHVLYVVRRTEVTDFTGGCVSAVCLDCTGSKSGTVFLDIGAEALCYVGECFMHGLMDGEILDMIGPERKRERPAALAGMDENFKKYYLA